MADKTQLFKQALKLFEQLPEGADLSTLPHGREPTVNDTKQDLEAAIAALAILQGQPISESSPTAPESSAGDTSDASETSQKGDEQSELDKAFAAALKYWSILQKKTPNELPKNLQVQKPRFLGMLRHLERQEPERLCDLADELQKLANKVAPRPSQGLIRFLTRSLHKHEDVEFPADLQPIVTQLKACTAPQDLNRAIINLSVDEIARLKKIFQEEDNKLKAKEGLDSLRRKNEALEKVQPANEVSQQRVEKQQTTADTQKKERAAENDSLKSDRPTFALDPELDVSDQSSAGSTNTANSIEGVDEMDEASTKKLIEGELRPLDQRLQRLEQGATSLSGQLKDLTPELIQKLERLVNNAPPSKDEVEQMISRDRAAMRERIAGEIPGVFDSRVEEHLPRLVQEQVERLENERRRREAESATDAGQPQRRPATNTANPWRQQWQTWVIGALVALVVIVLLGPGLRNQFNSFGNQPTSTEPKAVEPIVIEKFERVFADEPAE